MRSSGVGPRPPEAGGGREDERGSPPVLERLELASLDDSGLVHVSPEHELHTGGAPGHGGGIGELGVADARFAHPEAVVVGVQDIPPVSASSYASGLMTTTVRTWLSPLAAAVFTIGKMLERLEPDPNRFRPWRL